MHLSKLWVLQHVQCETLGTIADALTSAGLSGTYIRVFRGEQVPKEMGDAGGLIVMGGPMSVYEQNRYPFLQDEMRLIEDALKRERPVLGICLGSQLLAATLGARVTRGVTKEIGWLPVTLLEPARTDPLWRDVNSSFIAYHWHGDVFDLPQGASSLASSALTACQAFRYGHNVYGFLFHIEVTTSIINEMIETFADELSEEKIERSELLGLSKHHLASLQELSGRVFRRWTNFVS